MSSTMLKVAGLLNMFTVAMLPVSLHGPVQSPTTDFIAGPASGTKVVVSGESADSNGCALEPPVEGYAHWYDARDIDGDGILDEENDTDQVATWVDKGSAGKDLSQATSSNRPVVETDCRGVTGSRCVLFQDTNDTLAAATASDWDFISDDSTDYNVLVSAYTNTAAGSNAQVLVGTISDTLSPSGNGAMFGGMASSVATTVGMTAYRKGTGYTDYRIKYGVQSGTSFILNPEYTISDDGLTMYINGHALPSTTHATHNAADCPLYLARASNVSNCTADTSTSWYGGIHQVLIYKTTLSDNDREAVNDWMRCLQGAEPIPTTDSQGCDMEPPVAGYALWFDGRDVDGNGLEDSTDAVSMAAWTPKGTLSAGYRAETVVQGTGASQPTLDDDCITTDGPWCAYFDGGDYVAGSTASSWDFLNDGTDKTMFLLAQTTGTANGDGILSSGGYSGTNDGIFIYTDNNIRSLWMGDVGGAAVVNLNADNTSGTTDASVKLWSYVINFDNDGRAYLDGSATGTDTSFTSSQADGGSTTALEIGRYLSATYAFTGNVLQFIIFPSALSSGDRTSVETWLGCLRGD